MNRDRCRRFILFKTVLPVLLTCLGICLAAPLQDAMADMHAACAECHENADNFNSTYHGRAWKGMNMAATCESCHGTTDMHVSNPTMDNVISYTVRGKKAEELDQQCLSCHNTTSVAKYWDVSMHKQNDVACTKCHSIHTSRAATDQLTLCFTCHKSTRGQINKRSRHPLREGKVMCSDCHEVHGSEAVRHMIRAENVNQLCYKCHPDKRGPYAFEHPPVAESCANCHKPHGSRHAKLLAEKVPNLCQDCHNWSRHPGTPYDADSAFSGRSPSNRFFARGCLNCHGAIHGSSDLEHRAFTR